MPAEAKWVRAWFEKAEHDLLNAEVMLGSGRGAYDTICFHAQQGAEKYLKGFLVQHSREVDKTHDLGRLLGECGGLDPSFAALGRACNILTGYAIQTRYPGDMDYSRDLAAEALDLARRIRDFVLARIPLPPPAA
jgi:HEPN domain-containing protein